MTLQQKEYIQNNIDLIEGDKWENFFDKAPRGIGGVLQTAEIDFLSKMTDIPKNCFAGDLSLQSISIPNSIKSIGTCAFEDCKNLEEIIMPSNSLTDIGAGAFARCSGLESTTIPDSVTSIGNHAFSGCSNLTSITIPESILNIGSYAFENCNSLKNIIILNSKISLMDFAFIKLASNIEIDFNGTKQQWRDIYNKQAFANTYFTVNCTDGKIVKKKQ